MIAKLLTELGVRQVFFGAGDRNSALIESLNTFDLIFGLDERSIAFEAMGAAKNSRPTAICTTSGTASAACFPALVEAYYSGVKLVVVTADRPEALHGTYAPQTIEQKNLFGRYARSFFHLDESSDLPDLSDVKFPVHINIEVNKEGLGSKQKISLDEVLKTPRKVLAYFSEDSKKFRAEFDYLTQKKVHTFVEVLSQLGEHGSIRFEKDLLRNASKFDLVIKFGRTPVGKFWRLLNTDFKSIPVLSYQNDFSGCHWGERIDKLSEVSFDTIPNIEQTGEVVFQELLNKYPNSEQSHLNSLLKEFSSEDILYVGNSMPIRYIDLLHPVQFEVVASRGANGIDGQISTAAGIARTTSKTVHCIIGDLTFIYDFNRLFFQLPSNLKIHVVDNRGGRIFERVNTDKRMYLEHEIELNKHCPVDVNFIYPNNIETNKFWDDWNEV